MTPDEQAGVVLRAVLSAIGQQHWQENIAARKAIADAIRAAVDEQRERDAQVAESYTSYPGDASWVHCDTGAREAATGAEIAAAIRAGRTKTPEPPSDR